MNVMRQAKHLERGDKILIGQPFSMYTETICSIRFVGTWAEEQSIALVTTNDKEGNDRTETSHNLFPDDAVMVLDAGYKKN